MAYRRRRRRGKRGVTKVSPEGRVVHTTTLKGPRPGIKDKPVSHYQALAEKRKAAGRSKEDAEIAARKKRSQRVAQLEGMGERGKKELKRIKEGGSLKETRVEKAARQEKARMEGIKRQKQVHDGGGRNVEKASKKTRDLTAKALKQSAGEQVKTPHSGPGARGKAVAEKMKKLSGKK